MPIYTLYQITLVFTAYYPIFYAIINMKRGKLHDKTVEKSPKT